MVRYGKEHKSETRRRIIETAGRRFKQDGIDGSGVSTLMKDAGLTNGAFYAHFASKDDLVTTAIADQLKVQAENVVALAEPGRAGLEQIVRGYLSPQHREMLGDGCPNAALLDEIGRCTETTRQAYTDGVLILVEGIAERMAPENPSSARVMALSLLGQMAGTLQLARALTDSRLANELLDQGVDNALALLDAWQRA
ncbi:TetR/AcrR family transcriptional repressor of nem operon [Streptomyces sp. SAI-144]|uniref:TetR/AcrR family transcriptional regulator n=1 Tax=unclassified Streptomyces TaxID=2593676 RepID=UPI002475CF1C|nr:MULTISPECIES: TetR/AcrR family transcriptional regulator [unclassified Streptomyces]MDH6431945.1 TetR/AcrR family transcriptional repressor of nem operon [Streptomyces sp. SAI-144]MDH6492695.1 TetR/AcrR family transcriptional repressor of nem operon [Streptomyces sp. SAI-127]